jgi:hypothetical protein
VTEQEWDKERAEKHARWAKMASKLSYAPFARKIVGYLAPLEGGSTIVDLGTHGRGRRWWKEKGDGPMRWLCPF